MACDGRTIEEWFEKADLEKVVLAGSSRRFIKKRTKSKKKDNRRETKIVEKVEKTREKKLVDEI